MLLENSVTEAQQISSPSVCAEQSPCPGQQDEESSAVYLHKHHKCEAPNKISSPELTCSRESCKW